MDSGFIKMSEEDSGTIPCSRSQTVPDMSKLDQRICTPDSLISDSHDIQDIHSEAVYLEDDGASAGDIAADIPADMASDITGNGPCGGLGSGGSAADDKTQDSTHTERDLDGSGGTRDADASGGAWTQESEDRLKSAWTDIVEMEKDSMIDRLFLLEKKVSLQNDEICCLKATLSECLRRLANLETNKAQVEVITRDIPGGGVTTTDSSAGQNAANKSKIPQRRRHNSSQSCSPKPLERPKTAAWLEGTSGYNQYAQHEQNSSNRIPSADLVSARPYRKTSGMSNNTGDGSVGPGSGGSAGRTQMDAQQYATPKMRDRKGNSTSAGPNGPRRMSGSMGRLHKKWRSTSDFDPPTPAPLSIYKKPAAGKGSSFSFRSPSSTPYSSQHNLDKFLREKQVAPHEPVYQPDEGIMRLSIRGREFSLPCPTPQLPTYQPNNVLQAPYKHLKLEWVHGYRGKDARSNLNILPTGEIIYFVASVVVLQNLEEQSQRHYLGHTEEIKCMAVHPNRMIAATGQGHGYYKREGDPHIQVWNTVSLQRLHILGRGDYRRAIIALSFSKRDGGRWLVGVDEAPDVTLSVWDWSKGVKQIETKCSSEMVICVEFHPLDESVIVTCGKGHVNYWTIEQSEDSLVRRTGVLDPRDKPKFFTCIAFSNTGDVLTGDSNGNIFVWGRGYNAVTKAIWNAHAGPVFSICVLKDGHILTGGGKDGKIVKYTPELRLSGEEANLPPYLGSVRVIAQGVGNQILVGTTRNSILAGNMELNFATIVSGHCDEVWSLAARPGSSQYITAGHDRYIYLWDSLSCSPVWSNDIGEQVQGADFSPDGELLALTTVTGKWLLLDARTREIRTVSQEGCDPLLGVKFAPSGKSLAILARSALFLYQLGPEYQNFTRLGRFSTQAGVYGTIVWSKDSKFVQVTSTDRELQAWRICRPDEDEEVTSPDSLCGKKGPPRTPENHLSRPGSRLDIANTLSAKLETAIPDQVKRIQDMDELRDVDWTSTDCLLSWNCLGVWQEEGWEITVGSRAEDDSILVVGEENGSIRTYRYPACQPICKFNRVSAHSGPVTALRFLDELSRVITIGGRDTAVMQWTIES